jgi:penicillin-binding protein 1B
MAGKTGTTDEKRDSWYAGFSGDKVAVVWVGRDDYKPMGLAGGTGALRVWGDFMLKLDNEPLSEFPPDGVVLADACGRKNVPYIGDSAKGAASCGGGRGSGSRASGSGDSTARAEPAPTETPVETPPEPPPPPKPARTQNHFMSDFFGR